MIQKPLLYKSYLIIDDKGNIEKRFQYDGDECGYEPRGKKMRE
jgi:hypothetical protein